MENDRLIKIKNGIYAGVTQNATDVSWMIDCIEALRILAKTVCICRLPNFKGQCIYCREIEKAKEKGFL